MVEYITYKGKKYPIRIGYYVIKKVKQETGKDFSDVQEDISLYEHILFYALQKGCQKEQIGFPFTLEDMEDVLDECYFEFMQVFPKFFPEFDGGDLGEVKPLEVKEEKKGK